MKKKLGELSKTMQGIKKCSEELGGCGNNLPDKIRVVDFLKMTFISVKLLNIYKNLQILGN